MKIKKPEDADWYAWEDFVEWCKANGVSLRYTEDFLPSWEAWKAGYIAAMNER